MNKLLLFLGFYSLSMIINAQDVITRSDGEVFKTRVVKVTVDSILFDSLINGQSYISALPKSGLQSVFFQDGTQMIFQSGYEPSTPYDTAMFNRGLEDARHYYNRYKDASTGTLVASLLFPILGLIPAISCSSTPPKQVNLSIPSDSLGRNPGYNAGYSYQAKKIKSKKVWKNYGIGAGVGFSLRVVLAIAVLSIKLTIFTAP